MKIPKQVTILGQSFKVESKKFEQDVDGKEQLGEADFCTNTIYLGDDLSEHVKLTVLFHEIVHCTLSITGITNLLDDKIEEAICDSIGASMNSLKFK